jgi:hypothetical protein
MRIKCERQTNCSCKPAPIVWRKRRHVLTRRHLCSSAGVMHQHAVSAYRKNSQLELKKLETKATVEMNVEGMEKLIFTNVHFAMNVALQNDNEWERKKANTVYGMAQKICPIRQSWGEAVPIDFELNYI